MDIFQKFSVCAEPVIFRTGSAGDFNAGAGRLGRLPDREYDESGARCDGCVQGKGDGLSVETGSGEVR